MSTNPQATTTPASTQPVSIFFRLPREIRDQIYHALWHCAFLYRAFAPTHPTSTPTILKLRYRHTNPDANPGHQPSWTDADQSPLWLLTCKSMLSESTAQFLRNAEWYSAGYNYAPHIIPATHWSTRIPLSTANISRMELYVENLANYETPYRYEGTDTRAHLATVARSMCAAEMRVRVLRVVGHSYRLRLANLECDGQVKHMARNLRGVFGGLGVERFELGVVDRPRDDVWVLFEWVGDGERGLELMFKERAKRVEKEIRPEDDLEMLLPKGWVKRRKPCGCDDCVIERAEGGEGRWGGKM